MGHGTPRIRPPRRTRTKERRNWMRRRRPRCLEKATQAVRTMPSWTSCGSCATACSAIGILASLEAPEMGRSGAASACLWVRRSARSMQQPLLASTLCDSRLRSQQVPRTSGTRSLRGREVFWRLVSRTPWPPCWTSPPGAPRAPPRPPPPRAAARSRPAATRAAPQRPPWQGWRGWRRRRHLAAAFGASCCPPRPSSARSSRSSRPCATAAWPPVAAPSWRPWRRARPSCWTRRGTSRGCCTRRSLRTMRGCCCATAIWFWRCGGRQRRTRPRAYWMRLPTLERTWTPSCPHVAYTSALAGQGPSWRLAGDSGIAGWRNWRRGTMRRQGMRRTVGL
mmetsp:Transcript_3862/g.14360  ORF Transcript_3862/g.14360 Transcript_3862/m.14360 type:complete len:337 (+) Transcript_3862:766-1776(+)